jgi:xylulokinase
MRWNLEVLDILQVPVRQIIAVGGGARSAVWLQLKADVFGHPVMSLPGEAACRGAAICAGVAAGVYSNFEPTSIPANSAEKTYEPRARIHSQYNEVFEQYKNLAGRIFGFKLPVAGSQTHA